jgi:plastocyanin
MDPNKSRRWIAAAALAAAVVFLVMVTGEQGRAPGVAPTPVSSSEAVLATDGDPPDDDAGAEGADAGQGADGADRGELIEALQGLLDALGVSADELGGGAGNADCDDGPAQSNSDNRNGDNNGGARCEQGEGSTITIAGFAFGQPLTVAPGATVEVVNSDAAPHNVTAADGSFETPDLAQDETATFTAPTEPGTYEFTCTLHPEMTGSLVVEGNAAGGSTDDQGRTRSTEPPGDSQRNGPGANTSGGDHNGSGSQHQTPAPGRESANGTSDGY